MDKMQHKKVENELLKLYRNISPSYREMGTKKDFAKDYLERRNLLDALSLTEQLFENKTLIDIGGGTGEKTLVYALWGAKATILDPNEISCDRAVRLFKQFGKELNIENESLFDFKSEKINEYDIITCEGVLHHTYNPIKGLEIIVSNMKKGAILLLNIGEHHGCFKRNLQRKLVFKLAGKNKPKIIRTAKKYFQEHINKAVKFGLRSEKAAINDNFVNPHILTAKLEDICNVFFRNNIVYLSAYPTMNFFYQTRPWSRQRENRFNYNYYRHYYKFLEKVWMCCGEENFENVLNDLDLSGICERIEKEVDLLYELERKIDALSFEEKDLRIIQKGYMGVGAHFFSGVKI